MTSIEKGFVLASQIGYNPAEEALLELRAEILRASR